MDYGISILMFKFERGDFVVCAPELVDWFIISFDEEIHVLQSVIVPIEALGPFSINRLDEKESIVVDICEWINV